VLFDDMIAFRGAPSKLMVDLSKGLHKFWYLKPIVKQNEDGKENAQ